jgi:hypothetical protein
VAEHAELQGRQAARLPLGLEPPAEAHDAPAHGYRGRQRVVRSCHRYNDSTYNKYSRYIDNTLLKLAVTRLIL